MEDGKIQAPFFGWKVGDELNDQVCRELIDFLADSGIRGIFATGSQGEFWALSKEEKKKLFEITVDEVNGRAPVYAGTGGESTKEVVELTRMARDLGADAVSSSRLTLQTR